MVGREISNNYYRSDFLPTYNINGLDCAYSGVCGWGSQWVPVFQDRAGGFYPDSVYELFNFGIPLDHHGKQRFLAGVSRTGCA